TNPPPLTLPLLLNVAAGLHGALQTFAPRACASCMMLFSTVVPPGAMRVRNSESPMPVKVKFVPFLERPVPLFVEKNMSPCAVVQVLCHADDAPKPQSADARRSRPPCNFGH